MNRTLDQTAGVSLVLENTAGQGSNLGWRFEHLAHIIDKVEGPDAQNNVSIRASDILRIADDKKAVTPEPTDGELEQDINDVTAVIPVNADSGTYDLGGGILRIDNEVIRYTSGVFGGGFFSLVGAAVGYADLAGGTEDSVQLGFGDRTGGSDRANRSA